MSAKRARPRVHDLKCLPKFFGAVGCEKRFEVRRNDRDYRVGDNLLLREWTPEAGYTGRTVEVQVDYLLPGGEYGIDPDYCVMSVYPARPQQFVGARRAARQDEIAVLQAQVAALEAERDDWLPWTTWHRMPGLCWACQEWKTIDTRIRYHGSDRRRSQEETVCTHCGQRRHVDRREWGPRPTAEWGTAAIVGGAGEGVQP